MLEDSKCNQKKKNSNSIKVVLKKYLSEEANKREREREIAIIGRPFADVGNGRNREKKEKEKARKKSATERDRHKVR